MTTSTIKDKSLFKSIGLALLIAAFWLVVWQVASQFVNQALLLPSPATVWDAFCRLIGQPLFWKAVQLSLLRIAGGFLSAMLVGMVLAWLTARFTLIRALFAPVLHIIRAAPVASFIILTLVWIKRDDIPTFIAFLMVLPIAWVNTEQGIRETDPKLLEMATVYRFSFFKKLRYIYLPSVKPFVLSAAVNGLGFAWKSGVAAEVLSLPALSIGRNLYYAKVYLETPEVFAWTATVVVLSLLLERLLLMVTKWSQRRKGGKRNDTA